MVRGAISNPYAGTNRVRFKGFPRCRSASGFSAPCRGSPWNVMHLMPAPGQGQGVVGGVVDRNIALRHRPQHTFARPQPEAAPTRGNAMQITRRHMLGTGASAVAIAATPHAFAGWEPSTRYPDPAVQ